MMHIKGAKKLIDLPMLSAAEYEKVVRDFNDTAVDYPKEKTVHQLFEEQVERTPDRTAVIACDKTLTYQELNEQANRIANGLIENGVKPGDIVALMLPRRSYLIAAMFGVLKAGTAYLPIDPDYPQDRIDYILNDSGAKFCVTEENIIELLSNCVSSSPNIKMSSEEKCYCIYTSGSTGKPKGAVLTHRNVNNFCSTSCSNVMQKSVFTFGTRVLSVGSVVFDIFVFETILPLLNGLSIVIVSKAELVSSYAIAGMISKYCADVLNVTPSKLSSYMDNIEFCNSLEKIKVLMVGGEVLSSKLISSVQKCSEAIILNGYGPTETTCGVSFGKVKEAENYVSNSTPPPREFSKPILIRDLSVLSQAEREKILFDFNDTAVDYPKEKTVHQLFEEQVEKTPDKTAVIACDKTSTYSELNEQANRIAHGLIENGVKPGDIVALMLPRRSYLIAAMFGVLKVGAAYMPIDPDYPQDRIEYMLNDSGAKFCVTEENIIELLSNCVSSSPNIKMSSEEKCYCIYTSGSTGKPKGAVLTHKGLVNFCDNNSNNNYQYCMLGIGKNIISTIKIDFDIFTFEVCLTLLNGLKVILANEEEIGNGDKLGRLMQTQNADVLHATPTKLKMYCMFDAFCKSLSQIKIMMIGAEAFTEELYKSLRKYTDAIIYNGYGPAETTIGVSFAEITDKIKPQERTKYMQPKNEVDITIGKPIANTQIYILDRFLNPVPIGVPGELCIAGDGVGAGYLNRPELTAEKFIPNPFGKGKMYKTGDIAKWRDDGNIEYIGRNDFQVKIRGLRIELGEIENAISSVDGVALAVVVVRKDSSGRQLICAFYTGEFIEPSAIRAEIAKKLPKYMLPHIFTHLDKMPMTSSGKINRNSLPEIDLENISTGAEYEPPVTETEKKLCEIAAETLKHERVGLNDDFFELGGDSLKAIEFVSKAHAEGIYFALQNVFDCPTVKTLCEFIGSEDRNHAAYSADGFAEIHRLLESNSDDGFIPEKTDVGDVLITGATGFLGIHILAEYLENDTGTAYCLVRGNDDADAAERFKKLLQYYFDGRYLNFIGGRIIALRGDVQKENLGLETLPPVRTIVNCAASVKHYGSYKYFYDANVQSVKNISEAARRTGARLVHTSTLSVSGNSFADEFDSYRSDEEKHFGETDLFIGQPLDNVYARSKFEAEKLVLEETQNGLEANIFRMGNLTNRASDGVFQKNYESNAFAQRVKGIVELGQCPDYLFRHYVEFTPIDEAARAVMTVARHFSGRKTVFHINSTKVVYIDRLMKIFNSLGLNVKTVSGAEFAETLRAAAKRSETEYLFETFINDMDKNEQLDYDSNIRIDNAATENYLRRLGFEWGDVGEEYLGKWVRWFRDIGYWRV